MTECRLIKFKDFITLQRGFDLPKKDRADGPYPVVAATEIDGYHAEYKVSPPGVTTGRSGSLGEAQYISDPFWPLNTSLWVKDFKGNLPRYVCYYLKTLHLERYNSGAGVPTLNRNHLDNIEIYIHTLPEQRKVAAILSAYDDLIENNTRRIKILEETAQLIYCEWFVNFRFPGHENVNMVNSSLGSIPDGWKTVRTEQIVKRITAGKLYEQKTVFPSGTVPVLDQGRSGIIGYHNDSPSFIASEEAPVIVFANHTCYQRLIQYPFSAIQNVLPFVPNPDRYRNIYWLHWATKGLVEFNDYKGHWPEFMSKTLLLPSEELCDYFGDTVKPIFKLIYKFERSNINLRETRDLLLPKLISGELSVSDLDIEITEEIA